MTQEEKLLLKDLCARLPYEVIVSCAEGTVMGVHWDKVKLDASLLFELQNNDALSNVKPYLRPMSSMTAAEVLEYISLKESIVASDGITYSFETYKSIDWLNAHYFDYRGLIEKGLAIDATGLGIY